MKTIQNIFSATLKENSKSEKLFEIISELTFELSKKKIQRLKDDTRIQVRLGELFEMFDRTLQSENLHTAQNIDAVINGLIKASSYTKEEFLYKSMYEKEQLEKSILAQKESIKNTINGTFNTLEAHIRNMDKSVAEESLKALHDAKLRGVEMLGILKETTSEALLTTLEKADDIEDTIFEITKNIAYQTINEGEFLKDRFINITSSILEVACDIADEDHGNAKSILNGTIHGSKEGMVKAIEKLKNDLEHTPKEAIDHDLIDAKKELVGIENDFVEMVRNVKNRSSGKSAQVISDILENDIDTLLEKVKRATVEARETLGKKIDEINIKDNEFIKKVETKLEEFEKMASQKLEAIKQDERTKNATKEAKRLGNHAWEAAKKAVDSAIKKAKDVIK